MKDIRIRILVIFSIVCICLLSFTSMFGVRAKNLEKDIRKSQKIAEDWVIDGSISNEMAAFISYPQDLSTHTFSIYLNRPGLSFGYFFRSGGALSAIENEIVEYKFSGCNERAFISMNVSEVSRLEIDNGIEVQIIEIDSSKPFAIVVANDAGAIHFYDNNNHVIEYVRGQ